MLIAHYLILVLFIIHLLALIVWGPVFKKLIKKRFSWKILNFAVIAGPYTAIFFILLIPLIITGLKSGRKHMDEERIIPYLGETQSNYGFVDVRGQIHVHCYLSHDSNGTLEEITQAAKKDGIRWIILTDHLRKLPYGNYPGHLNGVLIIYGCERNGPEGTSIFRASLKDQKETLFLHGHIEGFGSSGKPELGGYRYGDDFIKYDAIEIVNFHANALDNKLGILESVFFQPDTLYDNITGLIPKNFDYWQKLAEKEVHPIPIFAGPDSHQNIKVLGIQTDPYELTLGLMSTHIWVEKNQELNQEFIFDAIKKGHTYIAFDYLGDTTGFQFFAETKNGKSFTGEIADKPEHLYVQPPDSLYLNQTTWDTSEILFVFYKNNIINGMISQYPSFDKNMLPGSWMPEPGLWRVELWKNGKPWIISGQIQVK